MTDDRVLAPELGGGPAREGLQRLAARARAAGVTPLLDLAADRVAAAGALAAGAPGLFAPPDPHQVLDPRRPIETGRAALARVADPETGAALGAWWGERLAAWRDAGFAGVRLLGLARLPGPALGPMLGALRAAAHDAILLGWTPGTDWAALPGLKGRLDGVFPSLPWWDWRSDWLWDEIERLRMVAPLIACPEAPNTSPPPPPLVAPWHTPEQGLAAIRRAVTFAAGLASGWMLPMGLEFGLHGRTPRRPGTPDATRAGAPLDLSQTVAAANAARRKEAARAAAPRLPAGAGTPVLALLRPELGAGRATLLLANTDLERARRAPLETILAGTGGRYVGFAPVVPADAPPLAAGAEPVLAPGEVRLYETRSVETAGIATDARRGTPRRRARRPGAASRHRECHTCRRGRTVPGQARRRRDRHGGGGRHLRRP